MNNYILTTVLLLIFINLYGFLYSYVIVKYDIFNNKRIQNRKNTLDLLLSRIPLIIFNVSVLILLNVLGLYFFKDLFITNFSSFGFCIFEVFFVLFIDDMYFYFLHRYMHKNKFIYKTIHKIHHRANTPMPIEYIYVHPLEWSSGMIGPFLGMIIIGGISFEAYLMYLIIRNLHEIHIHSGIMTSIIHKVFPFYGNNEHHDIHHSKRDGNYGSTFTLWDKLFKTRLN